jgi:CheY-like chemotaxis protein
VSIRELTGYAHTLSLQPDGAGAATWLSELIWREFYAQILWHHPRVVGSAFRPEYDALRFPSDPARLAAPLPAGSIAKVATPLAALKTAPVDVVITDLNMPVMDGVALIRALRADPACRALPILMLTTESDAGKKAEGKNAGATGWLVKPFDPERLVDVVRRVAG